MNALITKNLSTLAMAVQNKSASGLGSGKKIDLYGIKKLWELILELAVRGKLVLVENLLATLTVFVLNSFLLLALTEPHLLERASAHAVGLTVKHMRVGDVENLNIPLPPLAEQHRIVTKVNQLTTLCDQIKTHLQHQQQTRLHLADAMVDQALNPNNPNSTTQTKAANP